MSNSVELLPRGRDVPALLEANRENGWQDLDARDRVFIHEYAQVGDLRAAIKKVGMSRAMGNRKLRDPVVRAYLDDIQEEQRQDSIFTRSWIELELLSTYEKSSGEVDVPNITKEGDIVMAPRFNGNAALATLKEIKGMVGGLEDKASSANVVVNVDLSAFTGSGNLSEPVGVDAEVVSEQ